MLRRGYLSLLILLFSLSAKGIDAVVTHTIFYLKDSGSSNQFKPYVEVSWQINPLTLKYNRLAGLISAKVKTDIIFQNETGIINEAHFIFQTTPKANENEVINQNMIDMRRYLLPYGNIKMRISLIDVVDSNNKFSYADSFTIEQPTTEPFLSSPQLLDTFYKSAAQNIYQKSNYIQVPLCTNFYDENRNVLSYYSELYNTDNIAKEDYPIISIIYITKKENELVINNLIKKDTLALGSIVPMLGKFNIKDLQSGNYNINVSIINKNKKLIAKNVLFFQRYTTYKKPDTTTAATNQHFETVENINVLDLGKTFVAKYSLSQLKSILKMMLPYSDPDGVKTISDFIKRPNDTYMRYYIYNYFSTINKEYPEKAWEAFTEKIKEVNKLFSSSSNAAYETDRGIVYLRYGPPTDRIVVENEAGSYPYEVWQYNIAESKVNHKRTSNGFFLFYKPNETLGEYLLLHSNVAGEPRNKSWRDYLYKTQGGNMNAKAEQFIQDK